MNVRRLSRLLAPLFALTAVSACAGAASHVPHDRVYQRAAKPKLHPVPPGTEEMSWWETFFNSSFGQISSGLSPGAYLEPAFGPRSALDVNAFGKVPDSCWFENRLGRYPFTITEMVRGPNETNGPAPGTLMVVAAKSEGVTPGLLVRDQQGQKWVVKFDPPAHPGLSSAAEVISTKLLHAAGYHVPQNHIARFRLQDLQLVVGASTLDRYRRKVSFTRKMMEDAVTQLNPEPDGSKRAMFSRVLPGRMLGPFAPTGVREGDPNDRIPHERRRSLRGLWVFYAWVNNSDAKSVNTMDSFVPSAANPSVGYVRHYLIDFGSSFGAAGNRAKPLREGYEHEIDWSSIGARFAGVGAYYPYWSTLRRTPYRSVGPFESKVFEPSKWKPRYPIAAFEFSDKEDTFWAASILAHFDEELIGAAVSAGEYVEPGAAAWVTHKLIERRNKLLAYAFREMVPLDEPRVEVGHRVVLQDLERVAGIRARSFAGYRWGLRWERAGDRSLKVSAGHVREPSVFLRGAILQLRAEHAAELRDYPYLVLRLREPSSGRGHVDVRLRVLTDGTLMLAGLRRGPGWP